MRAKGTDNTVYTAEERKPILAAMSKVTSDFYPKAAATHCHPFIEFTGLMNEYIKICHDASEAGIDFTQANTHTGQALPMKSFHAAYLAEKLNCIYGPSLLKDKSVRDAFVSVLFDDEYELVPKKR